MKKNIGYIVLLALLFASCNGEDDGIINTETPNPVPGAVNVVVQNFMWQSMNLWYFWQSQVPNLADDRFSNDVEFTEFLEATPNPSEFFSSLQFQEDRFSFLNEDFRVLTDGFRGVSRSNGLEFGLFFDDLNNNNETDANEPVYGSVRYIVPNSNAATTPVQRGDIFTRVDGVGLTVANFNALLFGDEITYTLGFADSIDGEIIDNTTEITLTEEEDLVENPVLIADILEVNGQRIGYIMYNSFIANFDEELNNAFGELRAGGATDLVLDMRYNSGGSVASAQLLSSLIYGANTNDLFLRQRWNEKLQPQFSSEQLDDFFVANTRSGTPINALNLSSVFVITTNRTASSSELVMNGLDPYVQVFQIGTTTSGKNEFSITLVDDPENDFVFNSTRENQINPDNSWALQPLVGRNENSVGFLDYTDGFTPDVTLAENPENLGILGDVNEPLLAIAIQQITGVTTSRPPVENRMKFFSGSEVDNPLHELMILDKPLSLQK